MNTGTVLRRPAPDPLSHPSFAEIGPATQKGWTKERPLPAQFTQGEWDFRQLDRSKGVCLYIKVKVGLSGGLVESWEVILPKHSKGRVMPSGKHYPDRETYPKDEDWGTLGWSYEDEGAALDEFHKRSAAINGRRMHPLSKAPVAPGPAEFARNQVISEGLIPFNTIAR